MYLLMYRVQQLNETGCHFRLLPWPETDHQRVQHSPWYSSQFRSTDVFKGKGKGKGKRVFV